MSYTVLVNIKHDREKVLVKGFDLFWSRGYNSLGVAEICTTTGMTKGAFYNAFESKENFLLESIAAYGEMSKEIIGRFVTGDGEKAIHRLRGMYEQMLDMQRGMNCRGCLVLNTMAELGIQNSALGKVTTDQFNMVLNIIEPLVKKAQNEGDLIGTMSSKDLTELIHTTFIGVLTRIKGTHSVKKGKETMALLINSLAN